MIKLPSTFNLKSFVNVVRELDTEDVISTYKDEILHSFSEAYPDYSFQYFQENPGLIPVLLKTVYISQSDNCLHFYTGSITFKNFRRSGITDSQIIRINETQTQSEALTYDNQYGCNNPWYLPYMVGTLINTGISSKYFLNHITPEISLFDLQNTPSSTILGWFYTGYDTDLFNSCKITRSVDKWNNLLKILSYSTDVTQLLPTDYERTSTLFGVELELSSDLSISKLVKAFEEPFAVAKNDSSITGCFSNNAEMVTRPATLRDQRKYWSNFFKNTTSASFDEGYDTNNGLHVHICRKAFENVLNPNHLKRFVFFFANENNHDYFKNLSERRHSDTRYCPYFKASKFNSATKAATEQGRGALNLSKPNTIEVRIFKGIPTYTSVLKAVEFCSALVDYTRDAGMSELSHDKFIKFVEGSKYKVLKEIHKTMSQNLVVNKTVKSKMGLDNLRKFRSEFSNADVRSYNQVLKKFKMTIEYIDIVESVNEMHSLNLTFFDEAGIIQVVTNQSKFGDVAKKFMRK